MAKINDEQLRNIPISFSKVKEYESDLTNGRFTEVLIKILHLGRNYNGSVFNKNVVEQAIPSLANTPILGFIETNKEGIDDFSDHRVELIDDNGTKKMRYMGSAYGVIPESFVKESYFSEELCTDGIMREFLFIKGLLFNKFDYVIDMFKSHNGTYNQSMELSDNYSGYFSDSEGGFVFDSFQFNGACIITVPQAMIDSAITTNFSTKSVAEEIEQKLNEFAKYFSKKEDTKIMAKKEIEETIEQANVEAQVAENFAKEDEKPVESEKESKEVEDFEKNDDSEDSNMEDDMKEKMKEDMMEKEETLEDFEKVMPDENNDSDEMKDRDMEDMEDMSCKDKKEMSKDDSKKQYTLTFSLSYEDIRSQIYDKLYDMENIENTCYGIVETKDSYFIYADYCCGQFYKQSYIKDDTSIAFTGEREEIFNVFVDQATKDAIASVTYSKLQKDLEEANTKIQEYSIANTELLKFQADVKDNQRKTDIDGVIARFSKINELDLEKYKQKAYSKEISKEQLEDKLFAELGKMNFSKITGEVVEEKVEVATNYTVSLKEQDKCPYEGCESLFS